jgi:hypothetical protein
VEAYKRSSKAGPLRKLAIGWALPQITSSMAQTEIALASVDERIAADKITDPILLRVLAAGKKYLLQERRSLAKATETLTEELG